MPSEKNIKRHSFFHAYRLQNRPDDEIGVFDPVPVFPPKGAACRGRRYTHDYHREIAWSIDYRGDNDDTPTLLFTGAGYTLIKKVFLQLFGHRSPLFSGFRLYRDFYIYQRQAKAWVRVAVELHNYRSDIMRLEDLGLIIQNRIQRECLCNIQFLKLQKFLNI